MKLRFDFLKDPKVIAIGAFAVSLLLSANGYSATPEISAEDAAQQVGEMTGRVKEMLFSSTVRKVVLTIGGGAGLFQSFMSGSIRPLLTWGGLGLAVCYLPKFIDWIGAIAK